MTIPKPAHVLAVIESRLPGVVLAAAAVADALTGSHLAQTSAVDWTVFASALASLGLSVQQEATWAADVLKVAARASAPAAPAEEPKA